MPQQRARVFLVDGSAFVYRAFFAVAPSFNSAGCTTHAISGFISLILKLLKQHQPDYLAVVLDCERPTFRHEIFPEYRGNRRPLPATLKPQLPYIHRILEALGIAYLEFPGFEADDVISTLCHATKGENPEFIIVSRDKNLMQLVNERVRLFDSFEGRWVGIPEVIARFGVEPDRVTQVLALTGDSTDNIPGVNGIGEKTAIALIRRFDSLEVLYDNLDRLQHAQVRSVARVRKALESGKALAFLSRNWQPRQETCP